MINYSISPKVDMKKKDGSKKYYANLQTSNKMNLEELAEHISAHNSKYNAGDVYAVLSEMVMCMREFLLEGYSLQLGKLGRFSVKMGSIGEKNFSDFTAQNINKLGVKFSAGKAFADLLADAEFNYVTTKAVQQSVKKAQNKGEASVTFPLPKPTTGTPTTGNGTANQVTITAVASPSNGGSVTGAGTYAKDASVTLKATANSGYTFSRWSDGNTNAQRTVTASADATYTAQFTQNSGGSQGGYDSGN